MLGEDAESDFYLAQQTQQFSVEVKLKAEQELRFRLPPNYAPTISPIEVQLQAGATTAPSSTNTKISNINYQVPTAEFNGAPLGVGVRYKISPLNIRVNIFSWTGCVLRFYCPDPETFAKMEPYISSSSSIGWYHSVMELHCQLHEGRQRAMREYQQQQQMMVNPYNSSKSSGSAGIGPCLVIGGGPGSGRHQLASSLANLCTRSGGGACTVVDLDPYHQTAAPLSDRVPMTIGAAVWESTRIIDESTTPHTVAFTLASGKPFVPAVINNTNTTNDSSSSSAASLSYSYVGAVSKLLRLVRQRLEAQSSTRAGWSGTIIILPRMESSACCTAYANLIYRVCEIARADRTILLGTGGAESPSRSLLLSKIHQEYTASHGVATTKNGGTTLCFTRQLRGATLSNEVMCMGGSPSSLVTSPIVRTRLMELAVKTMLTGSDLISLQQTRHTLLLNQIEIAIFRSNDMMSATASTEVAARASPEQFKAEGEMRIVAFYNSLHDCSNFVQPMGYGVLEQVELGNTTEMVQTNSLGMVQQQKQKKVVVRTGKMVLPANVNEITIALVALPGVVVQL